MRLLEAEPETKILVNAVYRRRRNQSPQRKELSKDVTSARDLGSPRARLHDRGRGSNRCFMILLHFYMDLNTL